MKDSKFEHLGYFKEYYIGLKYIGKINCEKDRDVFGYLGKKTETITEEVTLDTKKKIKPNTEVTTIIYPLCGKVIKSNNIEQ